MFLATGRSAHRPDHRFAREEGFPYWTLACMARGATRVTVRGRSAVVPARHLLAIAPRTPYRIAFAGGDAWSETFLIVDAPPAWRGLLALPAVLEGVGALDCRDGDAAQAFVHIERVHDERQSARPVALRDRLAANALERGLLLARAAMPEADEGLDPGVRAARDWLADGPGERVTIASLARRVGMSPSHLAHRFAGQVGVPPMQFLERSRIARAQELLLATTLTVAEVAQACGWDDPFHFSRRFRARVGRSPRAYRRAPGTAGGTGRPPPRR